MLIRTKDLQMQEKIVYEPQRLIYKREKEKRDEG